MAIKNPIDVLTQAVKYPAALEAKLPSGAPVISTMLSDTAAKLPKLPDLPMEIPDLPAVPTMPGGNGGNGGAGLGKPFAAAATVTPVETAAAQVVPLEQAYTQPTAGVLQEVITRRGM